MLDTGSMATAYTVPAMNDKRQPPGRRIGPVGANLRLMRDRMHKSQADLALESGLSRGTIADLERGHSQAPDMETQRKLAAVLKIQIADLWREPAEPGQRVKEIRQSGKSDENLPGGLAGYIERHPELGPREIERLKNVAQSMPQGAVSDDRVWDYHLSAVRRQLAIEDGIV